jgi:hypothetical protein
VTERMRSTRRVPPCLSTSTNAPTASPHWSDPVGTLDARQPGRAGCVNAPGPPQPPIRSASGRYSIPGARLTVVEQARSDLGVYTRDFRRRFSSSDVVQAVVDIPQLETGSAVRLVGYRTARSLWPPGHGALSLAECRRTSAQRRWDRRWRQCHIPPQSGA